MQTDTPVSLKIVEKIAGCEDVPPAELQPPIHYAVDTDALDSLYQSGGSERDGPTVEFVYKGYTVIVDSTGEVEIEDQTSVSEPPKTIA